MDFSFCQELFTNGYKFIYGGVVAIEVKDTGQVFKTYKDYLKSFYWNDKVKAFKAHLNFKGVCPKCRKKRKSIDVHHRTYKNVGNEPFEDLVIMCSACHSKLHPDYGKGAYFSCISIDTADSILEKLAA
jgi:5-methylcytosine-specific restriction endonuclease McrA